MKPSDIYNMPTIKQWWEADTDFARENGLKAPLQVLTDDWHNHLPELRLNSFNNDIETPRLQVKIHFDPYIDGERCCTVGSAWYDGKPFMIFRHAGRSGHDLNDRFITDTGIFWEMIQYVRSLMPPEELTDIVDPEQEIPELNEFYGYEVKVMTAELSDETCTWAGINEWTFGQTCDKKALKDHKMCPWHECCRLEKLFYDICGKKAEGDSGEVLDQLNEMRVIRSYMRE